MVIPDRLEPETRGQILLVGAVAIAFIIIGLVIVFNTVLFTENVGSSESLQSTDRSGALNDQIRTGTTALVYRINDDGLTGADFNDSVRSNVTKYSNILGESQAESSGVIVNASFNQSRTGYGTMVRDPDNSTGFDDGTIVGDERDIGGFVLTVNVSSLNDPAVTPTTSNSGYVEVEDSTGATATVYLVNNSTNLDVWVNRPGLVGTTKACTVERGSEFTGDFVTVALSKGTVPNDPSCDFEFTHNLEPGYRVELGGVGILGGSPEGSYQLAVNGSQTGGWTTSDTPSTSPAVWRLALDVTYDSRTSRYVNRQSAFVYNTTR